MKLVSYLMYGSLMFVLHLGATSAQPLTVDMQARVTGVYDPANILGGQAAPGQTVTGRYTYETTVPDEFLDTGYGEYPHSPAQASARFVVGSLVFESDNTVPSWTFRITVQPSNNPGYSQGSLRIISPMNKPLGNGASVMAFDIDFSDLNGLTFSTDALPAAGPGLAALSTKQVFFNGELNGNWYNLTLEITSIASAGLVVSPASSSIAPQQRFDAALLLSPGSQIRSVQASRGGMLLPTQCNPASLTPQGNMVVLCADAHSLVQSGSGSIEWRVELQDDTVLTKNVSWEVVQ